MIKYPEVQKKAQEEIDRVVGRNRLPDYSDKDSLPYILAMAKETLRWNLVNPNGASFLLLATILLNFCVSWTPMHWRRWSDCMTIAIRSLLHDPEVYPEPDKYRLERFLANPPPPDPDPTFGYGRRICPGRFFSYEQFIMLIASILATFDILPPVDESGKPVDIDLDHYNGFVAWVLAQLFGDWH